jgi:zinc protease
LEKVDEAVKVILEEFAKIKSGDVTKTELAKAKEFLKGRATLRLENSRATAEWYAEKELLEGKIETPDEEFAKIGKVTLEDIERVAQRVISEKKVNLAIIGPYEDQERFLKLLS